MKKLFLGIGAALTGLFGAAGSEATANEAAAGKTAAADPADPFQVTAAARDRHWAAVGSVEPDVLTHVISPTFMGGPNWPTTRQAYRIVRRGGSILLATDGLSDPFANVEGAGNGFEIELFLETADIPAELAGSPGDISRMVDSWAFTLLKQVADTIAGAGGIRPQLERYGVLSLEVPGVSNSPSVSAQVPPRFVTADDAIGVLVGGPDPDFSTTVEGTPLSSVHLVPLVLITAAELEYLRKNGAPARKELAARLAAAASRHRSDFDRPDVAPEN